MNKELKIIISFLLSVVSAVIVYFNCGLYYRPVCVTHDQILVNRDILAQLAFLKARMHRGAATDMQKLYPEGYVFMNALYGLAWSDVAAVSPRHSSLYKEALEEVDWAYWSVRSKDARDIFDVTLPLSYGAFYCGWSNYLLGKKLCVEGDARLQTDVDDFKKNCERIANSLRRGLGPYPESYQGNAWPADGVMCVASLAMHDRLFDASYQDVIHRWVRDVKGRLDVTGLIPHSVVVATGQPLENARGSSQSLMLSFLREIDTVFARQQFDLYKRNFLDERLGLFGIREYPLSFSGAGDIDSGPVIWGIGAAASIVSIRTMSLYGEDRYAVSLRNSVEAFGLPLRKGGEKMYLFGKLPMADAFVTWSNGRAILCDEKLTSGINSPILFHIYSAIPLALCVVILIFLWRKKSFRAPGLKIS